MASADRMVAECRIVLEYCSVAEGCRLRMKSEDYASKPGLGCSHSSAAEEALIRSQAR